VKILRVPPIILSEEDESPYSDWQSLRAIRPFVDRFRGTKIRPEIVTVGRQSVGVQPSGCFVAG
jgi:hypothetical protein